MFLPARKPDTVWNVTLAFRLLSLLVAGTPVLAMSYGGVGPQFLTIVVAVILVMLPAAPRPDIARTAGVFRGIVLAAAFPVCWIVVQLLPAPSNELGHPIWRSAAAALSEQFAGHITIDLGITLRALFGYVTLLTLCFATAVLTQTRERAETLLFALCAITTFGAIELILFRDLSFIKPGGDYTSPLVACAVFGTILNVTLIIRTLERYETRGNQSGGPQLLASVLGGIAGAVICVTALIRVASLDIVLAMTLGMSVLFLVGLIRRLALRRWTAAVVGAAVLTASAGIIAARLSLNASVSPLFRFAGADVASVDATARMLSDATWFGSGVGTYPALAAIYRDVEGLPGANALNSVVVVVLGWGRLGLLIALVCLLVLFAVLFKGAISRGRDSFYSAAAAACIVAGVGEAFCDTSFTDSSIQMLSTIIVGLGLAQTVSHASK
ncbi:hypothetical protein [Bradyrhizobium sp. 76]|uniref:hypothetical protein n=1 Tax=Bradyrhizobium sp. 76 TaxID=2782680 RepID=UPI001FF880CE|nr:hypothetical protein [Bradyrhizobium sp. 76]MCK1404951.1 hypothetical protein [Bradyrhizobium sp. 76]